MHDRDPPDNALFIYGKRLFQEWLVDEFSKVESRNLHYLRTHQHELHVEQYHLFADAVATKEGQVGNIGRPIILPSNYTGSPRHMNQLFQDAMAIVRNRGTPSLFLTYTCNPNWIEIKQELKDGEVPNDRPDLICRVFKMKFDEFMKDLTKGNIFGKVTGHIHVIEFQKRGLPHAHILLILSAADKPRTTDDYDKFVCAMLPDKVVNPILYKNVTSFILHGPCGALHPNSPCMKDGKCKFGYPKPFANETTEPTKKVNPLYKREDDGRIFVNEDTQFEYDNRNVVPYNQYLIQKYQCHINVEICSHVTTVKYLYKYVYKGSDRAVVSVTPIEDQGHQSAPAIRAHDEIKDFQDGRYISASEAAWKLLDFPMHSEFPNVVRLIVHLPGNEPVYYAPTDDASEILHNIPVTQLNGWFAFNKKKKEEYEKRLRLDINAQPHRSLNTLYHDFPSIAVWKESPKPNNKSTCGTNALCSTFRRRTILSPSTSLECTRCHII